MPYKEFVGKTADDALKKAIKELDIPKEKVKYDVISYGSTGIFGLVRTKKARIQVYLPEPEVKAQVNHQDVSSNLLEAEVINDKDKIDFNLRNEHEHVILKEEESPMNEEFVTTESDLTPVMLDELAEKGKNVLERIVTGITDDVSVSLSNDGERLTYHIKGGDSSILIGKHGQTLDAIQYLVDKVINIKRYTQKVRVRIDVEGYLRTREESLRKLAQRLGDKAKRTGRSQTINSMSSQDRRIIHLALKHDHKLKTQSVGRGYYRNLVIYPDRKARGQSQR